MMAKEQNTRDRGERWTTPALIILVSLHIILITSIFVIHAKRRQAQANQKTANLDQIAITPINSPEFRAQGESILKERIKNRPEDIEACQELVNLYKREGRFNEAVCLLESALSKDPNQPELHMQLGILYYSHKDTLEKAIDHFKRVLELNPDHPQKKVIEVWLKEANKLRLTKGPTIEGLKQLLIKDPKNPDLHYQLSLLYLASPQTELQAIAHMEKVLEVNPDYREKMMIVTVLRRLKAIAQSNKK